MALVAGTLATLLREAAREAPIPVHFLALHWGDKWGLTCTSLFFFFVFFVPVMNYSRDLRLFKGSSIAHLVFEHIFFLMDSDLMQIEQHLSLKGADEPQNGTKGSTGQFMCRK